MEIIKKKSQILCIFLIQNLYCSLRLAVEMVTYVISWHCIFIKRLMWSGPGSSEILHFIKAMGEFCGSDTRSPSEPCVCGWNTGNKFKDVLTQRSLKKKMAAILKCIFLNENVYILIQISLTFILLV